MRSRGLPEERRRGPGASIRSPSGPLSPAEAAEVLSRARPVPVGLPPEAVPAVSLEGRTPSGRDVSVPVAGSEAPPFTLALFLSSSCRGCADLWELVRHGVSPGPQGVPPSRAPLASLLVVGVTRGGEPSAAVAALSGGATVVMSDRTWRAYGVLGAPYFVLLASASPTVVLAGVPLGAADLVDQLRRVPDGPQSR